MQLQKTCLQEKKKDNPQLFWIPMETCIPKPSDTPALFHLLTEKKNNKQTTQNLKGMKKSKGENGQQKVFSHNLYSYLRLSPADGQAFFLALILN